MKTCQQITEVTATFAPEIEFAIKAKVSAQGSGAIKSFQRLKQELLVERLGTVTHQECRSRVRRAADEAAFEAFATSYPLLLFPGLFEEKAEAASALCHERLVKLESGNSGVVD